MRFIFGLYNKRMNEIRAMLNKMMYEVGAKINPDLRKQVEDFDQMYTQYRDRCVIDANGGLYNGNVNSDWFQGNNGTKIRGLNSLKNFGLSLIDAIKNEVTGK